MLFPASATPDAKRLILARALRGLGDGFVSIYLVAYLQLLGFSAVQIGAIVTGMLVGSAALTLLAGLASHRIRTRRVLFVATLLMGLTGAGFASLTNFWLIFFIAFVGTLNPSAGDVSVFLPVEQSILAGEAATADRIALFARYSLGGLLFGAIGALMSGLPEAAARFLGWQLVDTFRAGFILYGVLALVIAWLYRGLVHGTTPVTNGNAPLRKSRPFVIRMAFLFALDSFGGGFVIDSLVVLWLFLRFDLSLQTVAAVFFGTRMLAALSQLVLASPRGSYRTDRDDGIHPYSRKPFPGSCCLHAQCPSCCDFSPVADDVLIDGCARPAILCDVDSSAGRTSSRCKHDQCAAQFSQCDFAFACRIASPGIDVWLAVANRRYAQDRL